MTDQELLKCYTDFVPFLAAVCGPGCEIVIHDVTNPEQSIIAIGNGISGRELGDPMTDLARELQEKGTYADTESLLNYKGKTKSGEFLSSTYFIKNEGRSSGCSASTRNWLLHRSCILLCVRCWTGSISRSAGRFAL